MDGSGLGGSRPLIWASMHPSLLSLQCTYGWWSREGDKISDKGSEFSVHKLGASLTGNLAVRVLGKAWICSFPSFFAASDFRSLEIE
ncbi:hypothetical protein COP2_033082 [Malus domestica]